MSTDRIRIRNSGLRMRVYGSEENFTDLEQCFKDKLIQLGRAMWLSGGVAESEQLRRDAHRLREWPSSRPSSPSPAPSHSLHFMIKKFVVVTNTQNHYSQHYWPIYKTLNAQLAELDVSVNERK
jgi:hypothetical protein